MKGAAFYLILRLEFVLNLFALTVVHAENYQWKKLQQQTCKVRKHLMCSDEQKAVSTEYLVLTKKLHMKINVACNTELVKKRKQKYWRLPELPLSLLADKPMVSI